VSGAVFTTSTAHIHEWDRDHSRPRNVHWEVAVWEDSIVVDDDTLYLLMAVHMESVVVPETIDCIRAMCGVENSAALGIRMTDLSLGMAHPAGEYDVLNAVVTGS
jgi:glyceraldehyde-3-phosphate dehydrogenase (NAD(P))